jgi:hypothetical protein
MRREAANNSKYVGRAAPAPASTPVNSEGLIDESMSLAQCKDATVTLYCSSKRQQQGGLRD